VFGLDKDEFSLEDIEYIKNAIRVFSKKWTTEIAILLVGKDKGVGFNEMMRGLDGISAAVLSNRLKMLQKSGYVAREVKTGPPTRSSYELTPKGKSFAETMRIIVKHKKIYG
jgi:DNA-binding HxlR family transcriptional regulator